MLKSHSLNLHDTGSNTIRQDKQPPRANLGGVRDPADPVMRGPEAGSRERLLTSFHSNFPQPVWVCLHSLRREVGV